MAVHVFRDARVLVGGQELTGQVRATQLSYGAESLDKTTLGSTTRQFTGGLKTVAFSHEGFWYSATTASTDALDSARFAEIGTSGTVVTVAAATSEGAPAYLFRSLFTEYAPRGSVGELFGYNVSGAANAGEGLIKGNVLWASTDVASGSTAGTAYNLTDSSSGLYAYAALHVLNATSSGATAVTVRIESDNSSTFPSAGTVLTFTATTAMGAGAAEWKSALLGSTDRWFRGVTTTASSESHYSIHLALGFSANA